jgi:hypothetical protein
VFSFVVNAFSSFDFSIPFLTFRAVAGNLLVSGKKVRFILNIFGEFGIIQIAIEMAV